MSFFLHLTRAVIVALTVSALAACGGGGSSSSSATTAVNAFSTLTVVATSQAIPVGQTTQLSLVGTDASGASVTVTSGVTWAAQSGGVFSVTSTGLVTGLGVGKDVVVAQVGNQMATLPLSVIGPWIDIAAGADFSLLRDFKGFVWSTGRNLRGQLGLGSNSDQFSQAQVLVDGKAGAFAAIAAGADHSLGVLSDGSGRAWGANSEGAVGDSTWVDKLAPTKTGSLSTLVALSAGSGFSLALKKDGTLWSWGRNDSGQLGLGVSADYLLPRNSPCAVPQSAAITTSCSTSATVKTWTRVSAGQAHVTAMRSDLSACSVADPRKSNVWVWGSNEKGQLTASPAVVLRSSIPQCLQSPDSSAFIAASVASGGMHSLAIRDDGSLWGWGDNQYGQIADLGVDSVTTPTQIGSDKDWWQVAAGLGHSFAIKKDGSLWAWGLNDYGQLGTGDRTNYSVPTQIGSDRNWIRISAGNSHTLALRSDYTLWVWGRAKDGQLGLNVSSEYLTSPTAKP